MITSKQKTPKPDPHIHTYVRRHTTKTGIKIYGCQDPDCYHTAPRHMLKGKFNKCPMCGQTHILTPQDLDRATPRCLECSNTKQGAAVRAAASVVDKLFAEVPLALSQPQLTNESKESPKEEKDDEEGTEDWAEESRIDLPVDDEQPHPF